MWLLLNSNIPDCLSSYEKYTVILLMKMFLFFCITVFLLLQRNFSDVVGYQGIHLLDTNTKLKHSVGDMLYLSVWLKTISRSNYYCCERCDFILQNLQKIKAYIWSTPECSNFCTSRGYSFFNEISSHTRTNKNHWHNSCLSR